MAGTEAAGRLLNLIIALTDSGARMTRERIRATVEGYDTVPAGASEDERRRLDAAFERKFERDKDDLRRLGIPLRTVVDPIHGDDIGYRIDAAAAALPPLDLSPAELAVVGIAADLWSDATLGEDARQALTKVASASDERPSERVVLSGMSSVVADAVAALVEAIELRREVRFGYSSAASGSSTRTVRPWRLVLRGGALYLQGHDVDRGEPRTFRLSRFHGTVRAIGDEGAFEIPAAMPAAFEEQDPGEALLAVRAEAGHALRARGAARGRDGEWDVIAVRYHHADQLRDEVLALAGAARVIEPPWLADEVRAHARGALEAVRG